MKKTYYLITTIVLVIIVVNIYYYSSTRRKQIAFQRSLLKSQTEICGSKIEQTGYDFESEINYILYSDDLEQIFQNEDVKNSGSRKLQMFYYKYEQLINYIHVQDRNNHVLSIYKDNKDKFIFDFYVSQQNNRLRDKETIEAKGDEFFYYLPIFKNDSIYGNIIVNLNFKQYIASEFENYKLNNELWQVLLNENGTIIYDNYGEDSISYHGQDEIAQGIANGMSGFTNDKISVNNHTYKAITVYFPVQLLQQDYGIAFNLNTNVILNSVVNKTIIITFLSILLLIITIYIILNEIKKKSKTEKALKDDQMVLNEMVDALPIGIVILNNELTIRSINKSAKDLLLIKEQEKLKGKHIRNIELLAGDYTNSKRKDVAFDENKFIYYEKNGQETVIVVREVPVVLAGEESLVNILIDITSIEKSRKQEAAANSAKSEFLAKMSHEIRTPMNGIIGMTDTLFNQNLSNDQLEYVGIIKKSANLLLAIINDILDFSKIEAGKMMLEEIPFKLSEELKFALELFRPMAASKNILLSYEIKDNVPDNIVGDPYRLRQVISNLISNAVKFTNEGEIKLSVELEDEYSGNLNIMFSVEDTGIGIPKQNLSKIFGSYIQADGSVARRYGGSGLGTTISKQLVNLMNGEIWVESPSSISTSSKYPGSKFSFTIEAYADKKITKNIDLTNLNQPEEVKVLIISENKDNNTFYNQLKRYGFKPEVREYNEELLNMLKNSEEQPFHVIFIMDTVHYNGFHVANELYNHGLSDSYYLMLFSRNDQHGNYIQSKKLNVDCYLIEPFDFRDVFKFLNSILPAVQINTDRVEDLRKDISILVAEDNLINQKVAQTIFKNLGYSIEIANDGSEVMDKVTTKKYDIIFTDLMMPEKDGWEVVKELRDNGFKNPIIAMTATASNKIKKEAIKAGMNDYLVKPVEIKTIKNLLIKFFSN